MTGAQRLDRMENSMARARALKKYLDDLPGGMAGTVPELSGAGPPTVPLIDMKPNRWKVNHGAKRLIT